MFSLYKNKQIYNMFINYNIEGVWVNAQKPLVLRRIFLYIL